MLNSHTGAVLTHYSEVHKALVMDGNTLLKDFLINQLNMGKKNHCLFMRSGKEIIYSRSYIAPCSKNIMKH